MNVRSWEVKKQAHKEYIYIYLSPVHQKGGDAKKKKKNSFRPFTESSEHQTVFVSKQHDSSFREITPDL